MGFFGRMPFGTDERTDFFEKWSTMTDEEKVDLMNKRMETMNNGGCGGFFGKREFTMEAVDQRCEEWLKKTAEEKGACIKERQEMMKHFHNHAHGHFFGRGRGFGFGGDDRLENGMNDLRDKWSEMTEEEKKEFIRKREDAMKGHGSFFDRCFTGAREPQM